jgi:archaeal flagellar protein FlaI
MEFEKDSSLFSYEVKKEGGEEVVYVNYHGASYVPNIVEYPTEMERIIDILIENPGVSRIVLSQNKNYSYDFKETNYLIEIANLYVYLLKKEQILSRNRLVKNCEKFFSRRYNEMLSFLFFLKKDPITAYKELKKIIIESKVIFNRGDSFCKNDHINYINLLEFIFDLLNKTSLIKESLEFIDNYEKGDREIYYKFFNPEVIPNFTLTRLVLDLPRDSEIIDQYKIGGSDKEKNKYSGGESVVTILRKKDDSKFIYHLNPPENSLSEEYNEILYLARSVLIKHQPEAEEFTDTERTRKVFFNISRDLIRDLSQSKGFRINYSDIDKLAEVLVRNTIGFGLIEVLLQDKKLQDIFLNSPISLNKVFLRHQDYGECITNIIPSQEDSDSWAAKFRMISGRPLDEANPILDTQLEIGNINARIAIIQQPLSPEGLAYAIRRHRESPWTLPLFISNRMINPFTAGLMSFLIDGARTILVAGTRSSGKTSLLSSLMFEILSSYRTIVIEDSLELPVDYLRKLNYDILRMKVRSALLKTTNEVSADDGIRTSLRLGDSCLIIGEVRSVEAKALYEAMRIGALANVVAGTIHGADPYSVFDRVVNDLEVPPTSFKATDIILVCNLIKSPSGLKSFKRVLQLTEVRKHWKRDPQEEGGFVDLLKYNVEKDELEPSEDLINGNSEIIKSIASNVRGWAGNWDAVYDNILLRAKIKKEICDISKKTNNKNLLEADFNFISNHIFHKISEEITEEIGLPLSDRVFPEWKKWLDKEIKRR